MLWDDGEDGGGDGDCMMCRGRMLLAIVVLVARARVVLETVLVGSACYEIRRGGRGGGRRRARAK